MSQHDYGEELNVRFSPDKTMVFFTSNLLGANYVFVVEVKKAKPCGSRCEGHGGAGRQWKPQAPGMGRRLTVQRRKVGAYAPAF